jgi:hypothetical protein
VKRRSVKLMAKEDRRQTAMAVMALGGQDWSMSQPKTSAMTRQGEASRSTRLPRGGRQSRIGSAGGNGVAGGRENEMSLSEGRRLLRANKARLLY